MKMVRQLCRSAPCGPAVLLLAACASMTEPTLVFETVALSGDAAPGDGSPFGRVFEPHAINNPGEVVFLASASGTGMWLGTRDSLALVARDGALAPGAGGATFRDFFSPDILVNDRGEVAFRASIEGSDVTVENDVGIWAGACGRLALVARDGDVAPGTNGDRFDFRFNVERGELSLNNKGEVAFSSGLLGNGVPDGRGIWVGNGGSVELVVRTGDPASGTNGLRFSALGIGFVPVSDSGEIAFRGELEGPGVDGSNGLGIWFGTRDTLALVARTGDIAPGAGGLVYRDELSNPPILNDNGKIGFTAELSDQQGTGVWSGTPQKLSLLARSGDVAPGTDGARFTGFDELGGVLFALNNKGEFVIFSSLKGPGVDDSNNVGIWFGTREPQALVVREGDVAPGTGGATFGDDLILDKISINDDGQVAFAARTDSGVGIWISSKGRKLELVARQGGEFEVAPDDKRTIATFQGQPEPGGISDIFDFGDGGLVFALDFTDGTSGIFTAHLGDHRTAAVQ